MSRTKGPPKETRQERFNRISHMFAIEKGVSIRAPGGSSFLVSLKSWPLIVTMIKRARAHGMLLDEYIAEVERRSGIKYPYRRKPLPQKGLTDCQRWGAALKALRVERGKRISEMGGPSKGLAGKYETGRVWPEAYILPRLAESLGVTVEAMLAEITRRSRGVKWQGLTKAPRAKRRVEPESSDPRKRWGAAMAKLREEHGFRVANELSRKIGATGNQARQWEVGLGWPMPKALEAIAAAYGMTRHSLVAELEKRSGVKYPHKDGWHPANWRPKKQQELFPS